MKKINIEKELLKKTKWMTLDYDHQIPFGKWETFRVDDNMKSAKIYRTKHGFHVIFELKIPQRFTDTIKFRYLLGDDPKRISHDIKNPRVGNRMFTQKREVNEKIVI